MSNFKILIVENECIVARDIQNMLERMGYAASHIAYSGKEAIKKAEETYPDLALIDIKLKKDMDGIEAAERIRSRFDIPIIYISALTDDVTMTRAKKTKPFFFINKPVEETKLHLIIEKAHTKNEMSSESSCQKNTLDTKLG